jgi:hypothetical protein
MSWPLYPQERPDTHYMGSWVGPRAGLDGCRKSCPHQDSTPDLPAHSESLYRLLYPSPHNILRSNKLCFLLSKRHLSINFAWISQVPFTGGRKWKLIWLLCSHSVAQMLPAAFPQRATIWVPTVLHWSTYFLVLILRLLDNLSGLLSCLMLKIDSFGIRWFIVTIYEAYSESKGRLVSKKNIFVRHIFYWRV